MRNIDYIVLTSTETKANTECGVKALDKKMRDVSYPCCPYHYVVRQNGIIETGRPEYIASLTFGDYDQNSISLAYEGGLDSKGNEADTRTKEQIRVMNLLLTNLKKRFPQAVVVKSSELAALKKAC